MGSKIIPTLRYRDAPRMMQWLCDAFGFEKHFAVQSPYIVVPDADAIYAKAKAAGAEIVRAIQDEDYGGRAFSCRDPEGHLWNFGTYDPWKAHV